MQRTALCVQDRFPPRVNHRSPQNGAGDECEVQAVYAQLLQLEDRLDLRDEMVHPVA